MITYSLWLKSVPFLEALIVAAGLPLRALAGAALAGVIAVVDDGGWPILIERMDHAAILAGVELAPGKARAAALFRKPSQALEDAVNTGRIAATTRVLPAITGSPSKHLTPRILGCESRPFRLEPCPFLCAMA